MKKVIIMCGIPGSGKSTWAREYVKNHEAAYVSRDEIRFSLVQEGEEYFSKEKEVFKTFVNKIKFWLRFNPVVVVDATHLNPASRLKLFNALDVTTSMQIEIVWVKVSLETALAQNELRKGTRAYVPQEVIRNMYNKFVEPEYDEIPTYYDKIWIVEDGAMILKEYEEEE